MQPGLYGNLQTNLWKDYGVVDSELSAIFNTATSFGRFEYRYLDEDGRTKGLEEALKNGRMHFMVGAKKPE